MNRIKFQFLQQTTNVPMNQIQCLKDPCPSNLGWISQRFPIYPITFKMYLQNPPFNKISLSLSHQFYPSKITFKGSEDGTTFFKIIDLYPSSYQNLSDIVYIFKATQLYHYLILQIDEPNKSEGNICKKVGIKGFQITNVQYFGVRYICSLKQKLRFSPPLFRILEVLQYKSLIFQKKQNQKHLIYKSAIQMVLNSINDNGYKQDKLPAQFIEKLQLSLKKELNEVIQDQTYNQQNYFIQNKKINILQLQKQLSSHYINQLIPINQTVDDYFHRFGKIQIKQAFLRYLSSPEDQFHLKALNQFWSQIKNIDQLTVQIQETVVMFLNYFLEYVSDSLKISSIKLFSIFLNRDIGKNISINYAYERYFVNILNQLKSPETQELHKVSLTCVFLLYAKLPHQMYIKCLLKSQINKMLKLQILDKVCSRSIQIDHINSVANFLISILELKQISLKEKNKVYNIAAYLATIFGKQSVMKMFEKLNTMIIINMERIIDSKISILQGKPLQQISQQQRVSCQFCGKKNDKFTNDDIYNEHKYRKCLYIHKCQYCNRVVQIPNLFQHYISECDQKIMFVRCDRCNQTTLKSNLQKHYLKCSGILSSKCPLCQEKVQSKLDLKIHLIEGKCPNNIRQ